MEATPASTSGDNTDRRNTTNDSQDRACHKNSAEESAPNIRSDRVTPRAPSHHRVALPTLATSYRPRGKNGATVDIPMEIAARLHEPFPAASPNVGCPSVQASKQLNFDQDWAMYGLTPNGGPTAARIIAGKVCNEGMSSPTEAFLKQLDFNEDDFIAALLTAADFVVDNCKRILTVNPQCKLAAKHLYSWEEIPQTPAETIKGGHMESLRWLVVLCLQDACDVYALQNSKEQSANPRPGA